MPSKTLDERINAHRASLARLLRQRIADTIRAAYPGATVVWIGEPRPSYSSVTMERITGPAKEIRWDSERELRKRPYGTRQSPCPPELPWSVLDDAAMLATCLPENAPRTKDGYLIVRLPDATENGDG